MSTNFEDLILRDTRANQPAASIPGRLYYVTDESVLERDNGATWDDVSTGAGGASTADHFILGQGGEGDSDLSNGVVIPMLTSHPDILVAGTDDDEFDTTSTLSSTFGTLDTNTSNTIKSHLHIARTVTGVAANGAYKASPAAISFTVTAKISDMIGGIAKTVAGVFVGEATPGKFELFGLTAQADAQNLGISWEKWTNSTTRADWSDAQNIQARHLPVYVRIAVDGSGFLDFYWSLGGYLYNHYAGYPTTFPHDPAFTIGSVGMAVIGFNNGNLAEAVFDWIRLV